MAEKKQTRQQKSDPLVLSTRTLVPTSLVQIKTKKEKKTKKTRGVVMATISPPNNVDEVAGKAETFHNNRWSPEAEGFSRRYQVQRSLQIS